MVNFVPVLLGTGREGRESEKVAKYIVSVLSSMDGIESELVDVRDFESGRTVAKWAPDDISKKWASIVGKANGLVVVSPEYNYMFPGELKIMIDRLVDEYKDLPVVVAGVSAGGFAGARVVEALKPYLVTMGMNFSGVLYFGNVGDLFDEKGSIQDDAHERRIKRAIDGMKLRDL